MKQLYFLFFFLLFLSFGHAQDFTVDRYYVDITIDEAGYFDVVETYDITFTSPKHGIYRDLLTKYDLITEDGSQEVRKIKINQIEVPNHKFKAPSAFEQKLNKTLQIKIGDPNKTVVGPQHYEIKYRVSNAFLHESDGIKFYWNLKASNWQATFNHIEFKVHLPASVAITPDALSLYSGADGTSTLSQDIDFTLQNGLIEGKSQPGFTSHLGESVTLLIHLPPNAIAEIKPFWPFWTHYGWTLILAIVIGVFYKTWLRFGKDDTVISTISYFPPNGMDPAMAGFLINDADDVSDLIALIPHWGANGILRIEEISKKNWFASADTKLIALKPIADTAPQYEQTLFNGLFASQTFPSEVLVSSLKDKFYTSMKTARQHLKKEAQPFYDPKARRVQNITYIVLVALIFIFIPLFLYFWGFIALFAYLIVTALLLVMNMYMAKKNSQGNTAFSELKGFRQFIKVAEINKLKMLINEDPHYFETTMGYALAFGLFKKWAGKFDALNVSPPTWYASSSSKPLTMNNFSNSFAKTMGTAKSNMVSSPKSSSSGGSSGGGFGGGGGGSW